MLLQVFTSTLLLTTIVSTQQVNSPSTSTKSALSSNINPILNEWIASSFGLMLEDNQTISIFDHQDMYSHQHEKRNFNVSHPKNSVAYAARELTSSSSVLTRDIASKILEMKMNGDGELMWLDKKEDNVESTPLIGRRSSKAKHFGGKKTYRSSDSSVKTSTLSKMSSSWKELASSAKKFQASTSNKKLTTSSSSKKVSSSSSASSTRSTSTFSQAMNLSASRTFTAVITWYNGNGLKNPYCAQRSKWTPSDSSMIAAVTEKWGDNRPACGSFLQVRTAGSPTSIIVRVVDTCGGCQPGVPHIDLSTSAFQKLYALNVGEVHGIEISTLDGTPVGVNWGNENLYGPENL